METSIPLTDLGTIGILLSAIGGLWAWHIKTVSKKDEEIKEARKVTEELVKEVSGVVKENTKVSIEQTQALIESRKSSEKIGELLTDYILKAAGK